MDDQSVPSNNSRETQHSAPYNTFPLSSFQAISLIEQNNPIEYYANAYEEYFQYDPFLFQFGTGIDETGGELQGPVSAPVQTSFEAEPTPSTAELLHFPLAKGNAAPHHHHNHGTFVKRIRVCQSVLLSSPKLGWTAINKRFHPYPR
jgi:hypothetical protein